MDLQDMLQSYAVESGVVSSPEPSFSEGEMVRTAGDIIHEESYTKHEETLADKLDHAEKARDIAEHLEELAERAEELADEDHAYARNEVSVEALHREFRGLMRAHRLSFSASSFEHAYGDVEQLHGLAKDARRTRDLVSNYSRSIVDYSSEGEIIKFLRRDASKLADARESLVRAEKIFNKRKETVSKGQVVRNNGLARFMTVGGSKVTNLKEAVSKDAKWLEDSHSTVMKYIGDLLAAANKAKPGSEIKLPQFPKNKLTTSKGDLLGNYTVTDELKRRDEFPKIPEGGAALSATLTTIFSKIGWSLIGGLAAFAVGGPVGTAIAYATPHLSTAAAVVSGVSDYNAKVNQSSVKSVASAEDLQNVAKIVLGFEKFIKVGVDENIDNAIKKLAEIDKKASREFEDSISLATKALEVIYEHAFYVTVNVARILEVTVEKN